MNKSNILGQIKIIEVVDNGDGTARLDYEVTDALRKEIKRVFGWNRWSSKKFNEFFLEELNSHAKTLERELGDSTSSDQRCVDVFDNKVGQSNS